MKFTAFAWPFGIVCITIAVAALLLHDAEPPGAISFAPAAPPKT